MALILLVNLVLELIKGSAVLKQPNWLTLFIILVIAFLLISSAVYNVRYWFPDAEVRLQQYLTWYLMEKDEASQSQTGIDNLIVLIALRDNRK